jgi:hypothetical protein
MAPSGVISRAPAWQARLPSVPQSGSDLHDLFRVSNRMNGNHQEDLVAVYGAWYQRMIGDPESRVVAESLHKLDDFGAHRVEK